MIIKSSKLKISAVNPSSYPDDDLPCIAFAGRSNVGKSSLVNSVLKRKTLARVSQMPGKTRTINFYLINDNFYIVDLPGYGYAKLSKEEKDSWGKTMELYFSESKNLKHLFLLLDIRHEPKETDRQMYEYCKYYNIPVDIIATKSDKISRGQYQKSFSVIKKFLNIKGDEVKIFPISSLKKTGIEEVSDYMEEILKN
ncbi:ribosome biogenesis GTP-binding protein YsxC [Peptoanaerobacter stomatis]|uniref:Probable GTP-binding protein EngB n=1 Tax=Peptoanaerobacter stomatis TaxID=796937 RepID=J5WVA0_9FIRM|nr:ribosome biogenesis GTP-binding protein YihA/YsxC [Peptoanaerobacter stomatis]EHL17995.1 ribosome biogenesis GTP-binding protein YsxC [Peptoanaerobacter stomatis]EJU24622.1 ribosome biogenesis GTP-binding protein YsxC [Peptoanaerobacter stomatis]NWO25883.1 YihA family ribosome biogenesis GTP-binding protein [Peptostreptococcaceae bacterium oral taxon 081]